MRRASLLSHMGRLLFPFIVLGGVWQAAVMWSDVPSYFFPGPTLVLQSALDLLRKGILSAYTFESLGRLLVASGMAIGVAVPLGLVMGSSRTTSDIVSPFISFFQSIAEMAWLPIAVLWFGFGTRTIVFVVAYTVFFPVLSNSLLGVRRIPKVFIDSARTMGGTRIQLFKDVLVPGALPNIVTGVRVGVGYAFRAIIAAEMIAGQSGIGYMIFEARRLQLTDRTIVGMIVVGILWLLIDRNYLKPLEAATIERWGMVRRAVR